MEADSRPWHGKQYCELLLSPTALVGCNCPEHLTWNPHPFTHPHCSLAWGCPLASALLSAWAVQWAAQLWWILLCFLNWPWTWFVVVGWLLYWLCSDAVPVLVMVWSCSAQLFLLFLVEQPAPSAPWEPKGSHIRNHPQRQHFPLLHHKYSSRHYWKEHWYFFGFPYTTARAFKVWL